jgi:hypothetical protein
MDRTRPGLVLVLALLTSACRGPAQSTESLADLADIEQFRARFNQDAGTPRLLLLLSPT